jgi:hypothetical protein
MITIDSFYTIHKVLLVEISRIFKRSRSSSRGGARKGSLKTGYMLFGAYNLTFSPECPHDIVISRGSRLCCEIPVSGGRVFELGDEILLKDNANKGILTTSLETGVSILTVGNVSSRILQVPIIVVFTKYDQLVIRKKFNLARSLANDHKVEWARQAKEAATEEVKVRCGEPLNAVAGRHTWTEISSVYYSLDDLYSRTNKV